MLVHVNANTGGTAGCNLALAIFCFASQLMHPALTALLLVHLFLHGIRPQEFHVGPRALPRPAKPGSVNAVEFKVVAAKVVFYFLMCSNRCGAYTPCAVTELFA